MRTNARTFPAAEVVPESDLTPLELGSIFARIAPLEVDLGCGDGAFVTALAREHPERNFLGVERLIGRVRSTARKIGDQNLGNARILRADILHAVQHLLPPESVHAFYLMFPDPWPKRRHATRRTFSVGFLSATTRALTREGLVRIATDDADYVTVMQRVIAEARDLVRQTDDGTTNLPASTFEARFRASGAAIHRFALRKV
jgi:tRNA (guanine-N7-)-methyltransferase